MGNKAYSQADTENLVNAAHYFDTNESLQFRGFTAKVEYNVNVAQLTSYLDKKAGLKATDPSAFQTFLETYLPQVKGTFGAGVDEFGNYVENFSIEANSGSSGIQYDSQGTAFKTMNVKVSTEQGIVTVPFDFEIGGGSIGAGINADGQEVTTLKLYAGNDFGRFGVEQVNMDSSALNQDEQINEYFLKLGDTNDGSPIIV